MTRTAPDSTRPGRASARVDAALADLRRRRQRVTAGRSAVIQVLDTAREHLDAADIVDRATELAPGVHRATVYRALATLCDLGVVTHTHIAGSGTIYHLRPAYGPAHVHLRCRRCKTIIDLPADTLDPLRERLDEQYGFTLEPEHAGLLGTCVRCRADPDEGDAGREGRTTPEP